MKNLKSYLFLILSPFLAVYGGARVFNDYQVHQALETRGVFADAVINSAGPATGKRSPENNWRVSFTYRTREGKLLASTVPVSEELASHYRTGQKARIIYDPNHSTTAALSVEQALETYNGDLRLFLVFVALTVFIFLSVFWKRRSDPAKVPDPVQS
jgi:hypothetical protein